jgi:SNF2-related domain
MSYTPLLAPRDHQLTARKKMSKLPSDRDVYALLMEMGTGKSKVIVDEFGERADADDVSDLLLFAPAGCYLNWTEDYPGSPGEFKKHMDPAFHERLIKVPWFSGASKGHMLRIRAMMENRDRPRAFIINCEAMGVQGDKALRAAEEFIETSRRGVIVTVDESTTIKNPDANRSEKINQVASVEGIAARRILTGLATPNSPLDLFQQFMFLDWRILGFQSFVGFRARYAYLRNLGQERGRRYDRLIPIGFKNIEELHPKIEPWSYRVLKKDCLDLPEKVYMPIRTVDMTDQQRKIYKGIKEEATAQLTASEWVTTQMVLDQRLRLDQVLCGFTVSEGGNLIEIPERRTATLLDLLADYQGKAIIWTTHDYCIRKLARILEKEYGPGSVAQFWGGNRKTRHMEEARWKGDPVCRWMLSTPAAGGRGNTWVQGGLSVFYNNNDNLEHRLQAEDRNHRDGLMGPVGARMAIYEDLMCPGTLDYQKVDNLRRKIDLATMVMGDDYLKWIV